MAQGRTMVTRAQLDSLFGQIRSQYCLDESFQLVHHFDKAGKETGRVSLMRVTSNGLVTILDSVAGNTFVDSFAIMFRFLAHVSALPGGRVVG